MKKRTQIRRKPGLSAAGSWLIPIAFTAAAVVSIVGFNGDMPAYAAFAAVPLQTMSMPGSQPASR
jgi:hypothetical protein